MAKNRYKGDPGMKTAITGLIAMIFSWIPFIGIALGVIAAIAGLFVVRRTKDKQRRLAAAGLLGAGAAIVIGITTTTLTLITLNDPDNQEALKSGASDTSISTERENVEEKREFSNGETARFGDFQVSINSVTRNYIPENKSQQARDGMELVVVNFTVKNVSNEPQRLGAPRFMLNEGGREISGSYFHDQGRMESGELAPEESARGNITYEVTDGATDLKLQYKDKERIVGEGSIETTYTLEI